MCVGGGGAEKRMKINEKRVARPPKAAKLEIHFEGNLICCKWAKNISGRRRSCGGGSVGPSACVGLSVCRCVGVSAAVCLWQMRTLCSE